MSEGESKTSSCLKILGIGCVVVIVVGVLAVGTGVYYVKTHGLEMAAKGITVVTDGMIKDSKLSDSDKAGVRSEIARFTTRLKAGEVSMNQVKKLADTVQQGPLPALLFLQAVATGKLIPPEIPAEESAAARLDAQRLQRAAAEGKVTTLSLQEVLRDIPQNEQGKPKEKITPEDWRPVMAKIKKMADDAGIPNEPYQMELTQEIRKVFDEVLDSTP